jgi:tetratricopeptide (TPR) repeat protein
MKEEFFPEDFSLHKLPIPVPPMLEAALGYPGAKRYVAFHECRVSAPGLFIDDVFHTWPGVEAGWSLFCKHPAVARILEALRLDLKRNMPVMRWDEWIATPGSVRGQWLSKTRCLLLDRQDRILYVGVHQNVILGLEMEAISEVSEADGAENEISDDDVDTNAPAVNLEDILKQEPDLYADKPVETSRAVLEDLREWLNDNELLDDEYTPGRAESCGFRKTYISVERGQIEEAFGYGGGRRYISLHLSPKAHQIFVCDGLGRWSLSAAVDTWNEFLNHPLVKPHLQRWDESEKPGRSVQLDFAAEVVEIPETPLFSSEQAAHEIDADVKTNCLLYDRADNDFYTGTWASALLFHSLVEDVLEEDLVPDDRPKATSLLAWLNEHRDEPARVFAVAASHHEHQQEQDALTMLRRCIEQEPGSHLYWCRLSQTLGSLSRWEEALEAIEKAITFHASAPRQYVTARYMIKWKGNCLFWLKRYSEAADTYRFAIEIDEASHKQELYSSLARCYERMGSIRDAIHTRELQVRDCTDWLAQAQRRYESDEVEDVDTEQFLLGEAWFDLGRCYLLVGDFVAAEWALRRATETDRDCIRASAELGVVLRQLGRAEESEGFLQQALALATTKVEQGPTLGAAHSDLAFVYRALGRPEAAHEADQRAIELQWKSSEEQQRVVSLEAVSRPVPMRSADTIPQPSVPRRSA